MIKELKLDNGATVYVEVSEVTAIPAGSAAASASPSPHLPKGAEQVGFAQDALLGTKLLKETIAGVAQSAFDSLKDLQPDEWSVEFAIGMKADKLRVIPVLLTGSAEANFKITAKWVKTPAKG